MLPVSTNQAHTLEGARQRAAWFGRGWSTGHVQVCSPVRECEKKTLLLSAATLKGVESQIQASLRAVPLSVCGNIQNSAGHIPEHPDFTWPC